LVKGTGFLKSILVPVDGSSSSTMAEETAATIAKRRGAAVKVLHVMQDVFVAERLPDEVHDELAGSVQQRGEVIVDGARALFAEEKVEVEAETVASHDVAGSILEYSRENCDLIVMGAHGENEKAAYTLGSVTRKVTVQPKCPVFIAKKMSSLSSMLVCVDGSKRSIRALEFAAGLAELMDSSVTLLYVQEQRLHKASPKVAGELGERVLARSLGAVEKRKLKVDKRLEVGVASDTIVEVAEKGKYDVIVLGSRGLGAVKRFLLGSVSDDVTQKARCSVLVVP
jgi:nucleotide-binding universal stress UspA family protein